MPQIHKHHYEYSLRHKQIIAFIRLNHKQRPTHYVGKFLYH
jgi:hypothetical protein